MPPNQPSHTKPTRHRSSHGLYLTTLLEPRHGFDAIGHPPAEFEASNMLRPRRPDSTHSVSDDPGVLHNIVDTRQCRC